MPLRHPNKWQRSNHQKRVEDFMVLAKQELPESPTEPSEAIRLLRAKLIFEEAIETLDALGVSVFIHRNHFDDAGNLTRALREVANLQIDQDKPFNMVEVVDGCCDLIVVTTGTLSALGVADMPVQELVDGNNLDKFGPGHTIREDGKLCKPPGHKPPDIVAELIKQGWPAPITNLEPKS